jgi:hypothetical protein
MGQPDGWEAVIVAATEVELVAQYVSSRHRGNLGTGPYAIRTVFTVRKGTFPTQGITAFVGDFITPKLEDSAWLAATAIIPPGVGL